MKTIIGLVIAILFSEVTYADEIKSEQETPTYEFEELSTDSEYAGVYRAPHSILAGENLYIFPDKTFVVTYFCDICMGETVLTKGTYRYSKSKITLKYSTEYQDKKEKIYYVRYGLKQYDHLTEYDSYSPLLLDEDQFSNITHIYSFNDYLHRVTPYPNWKKQSEKLKHQPVKPDRDIPLPKPEKSSQK